MRKFEDSCKNNKIRVRDNEKRSDYPEDRNWTLHSNAKFQFLGFNNYSDNIPMSIIQRAQCSSVEDITKSVMSEYGSAENCIVPWQSIASICRIFSAYSTVIWTGDSLTRHTYSRGLVSVHERELREWWISSQYCTTLIAKLYLRRPVFGISHVQGV